MTRASCPGGVLEEKLDVCPHFANIFGNTMHSSEQCSSRRHLRSIAALFDRMGLTWGLLPEGGLLKVGRSKICMESLDSKLDADLMTILAELCLESMAADPCRSRAIILKSNRLRKPSRGITLTFHSWELTIHAKLAFWCADKKYLSWFTANAGLERVLWVYLHKTICDGRNTPFYLRDCCRCYLPSAASL